MVKITVPVTISGNSLRICFNKDRKHNCYDTANDLRAHDGPNAEFSTDGSQSRNVSEARTMITGRAAPILWNKAGNSCKKVANAVKISAAWIIMVFSASVRPQVPAMIMDGVMTPTIAASTCCLTEQAGTFPVLFRRSQTARCRFLVLLFSPSCFV